MRAWAVTIGEMGEDYTCEREILVSADWLDLSAGALHFQSERDGKLVTVRAFAPGRWLNVRLDSDG